MINWGYWTFSNALYDAVVVGREGWKIDLQLPQCGGVSARLPSYSLMSSDPADKASRVLERGSGLRVMLHFSYDGKNGFELSASECDARQNELGKAVREAALRGGEPYYVRVRVFEKMTGALGVRVVSEPYQGLRGVIHRTELPGRDPAAQHAFAKSTAIGSEFIARVLSVSADTVAHWQLTLRIGNHHADESLPAVTEPAAGNPIKGGVRRWLPVGQQTLEAVVAEREGQVVRLIFKPRPHTQMVLNLYWHGLSGVSAQERRARFDNLAAGDKLMVRPEVYQSSRTGLELRATERPAKIAALTAECANPGQHLLLSAQVTRVYRHKAQATILSTEGRGIPAYIDLAGQPRPAVGAVVQARLVGVDRSVSGRASVRLSGHLVPDGEAGQAWRLSAVV